jgi:ABC-type proline/glycine betaine transport system permease subunit
MRSKLEHIYVFTVSIGLAICIGVYLGRAEIRHFKNSETGRCYKEIVRGSSVSVTVEPCL